MSSFKLNPDKPQSIVSPSHKDHDKQHSELCKILSQMLNECNYIISDKKVKVEKINIIFSWLSKNLYLFNKHYMLLNVTKEKLLEFDNDEMGRIISNKYRWMLDLQHPVGAYSSFGRKIIPVQTQL